MLGAADWDVHPRRLRVDGPDDTREVLLSWFDNLPAGRLTAIYADGRRVDLLTLPRLHRRRGGPGSLGNGRPLTSRRGKPLEGFSGPAPDASLVPWADELRAAGVGELRDGLDQPGDGSRRAGGHRTSLPGGSH
ncbi:hypothetical protein LUX57_23920 [Actinomadura madurae]|uniref:hypothetical protein n=1 Tax=Actinomadura madurae TaxID=1993 RepID=UPI0020D1FC99|nr:hypothetical protein [Actinomadura madurae]MCP9967809.1 hypothetical protein [Actinomadura madurae]